MVKEEAWMKHFITLDTKSEKWIAWDELQVRELGRFGTHSDAIIALKKRVIELDGKSSEES